MRTDWSSQSDVLDCDGKVEAWGGNWSNGAAFGMQDWRTGLHKSRAAANESRYALWGLSHVMHYYGFAC
jgi:hypothetical protein